MYRHSPWHFPLESTVVYFQRSDFIYCFCFFFNSTQSNQAFAPSAPPKLLLSRSPVTPPCSKGQFSGLTLISQPITSSPFRYFLYLASRTGLLCWFFSLLTGLFLLRCSSSSFLLRTYVRSASGLSWFSFVSIYTYSLADVSFSFRLFFSF